MENLTLHSDLEADISFYARLSTSRIPVVAI